MVRTIAIATALVLLTASSFSANAGQRSGVQGGNALDKPTFGEKFKMNHAPDNSVGFDQTEPAQKLKPPPAQSR